MPALRWKQFPLARPRLCSRSAANSSKGRMMVVSPVAGIWPGCIGSPSAGGSVADMVCIVVVLLRSFFLSFDCSKIASERIYLYFLCRKRGKKLYEKPRER